MITITNAAAEHIKKIIAKKKAIGFRLAIKKTGCHGYMYQPAVVDKKTENDIEIKTDKAVTIFIQPEWQTILKGTEIDLLEKGLGQQQIVFNNPNVDSECGCGESFSLKEE